MLKPPRPGCRKRIPPAWSARSIRPMVSIRRIPACVCFLRYECCGFWKKILLITPQNIWTPFKIVCRLHCHQKNRCLHSIKII